MLEAKSMNSLLWHHWSSSLPSTNSVTKVRLSFATGCVYWIFNYLLLDAMCSTELSLSVLEQNANLCGAFWYSWELNLNPHLQAELSHLLLCLFFKEKRTTASFFDGKIWLNSYKPAIGDAWVSLCGDLILHELIVFHPHLWIWT